MSQGQDKVDARLAELARATGELGARAGFTDRVMREVYAEASGGLRDDLVWSARRLIPLAAIAAALAVTWASITAQSTSEVMAVADDTGELEW